MNPLHAVLRKMRDLAGTISVRKAALQKKKPIVGYIGWMGHGNLGDDAMWQAARESLPGMTVVPYDAPQRERLLARLGLSGPRYFHSVILGGGTLISPRFFPPIVATALDQNINVWSWGTGVGSSGFEMDQQVDLALWKPLLPRFQHLGVRGPLSMASLKEMDLPHAQVVGDLALSLCRNEAQPATHTFVLNLSLPSEEDPAATKRFAPLKAPLSALIQEGWRPIPIAMTEADIAPTSAFLAQIMPQPPAVKCPQSVDELFDLTASCAFTVGVRLHAAVLSCCVGVPPIMLGYRSKCLDFMESMKLAEWYLPWEDVTELELEKKVAVLKCGDISLRRTILEQANSWRKSQQRYIHSIIS